MKNKLNAMKLSLNLKSLKEVLLRMLYSVELVKRFQRKFLMNGRKWTLLKTKKFINTDSKILL
jgi:hypothetical protein